MPSDLQKILERAAHQPAAEPDFDALARRGRRRRHMTQGVSAASVIVLLAVAVVALPRPPQVMFDSGPRAGVGAWEAVPAAPIGAREGAQALADGARVVVVGGLDPFGESPGGVRHEGAVYDLLDRTWSVIPMAPLADDDDDGFVRRSMLLPDGQLLVWDLNNAFQAAIYDFANAQWTGTGAAPGGQRYEPVVQWADGRLVVWGGVTSSKTSGAVWDPASGEWSPTARSPLAPRSSAASAASGADVIIWGGARTGGTGAFDDGAIYDATEDAWRPMARSPLVGRANPATTWEGTVLTVAGGDNAARSNDAYRGFVDGARYDVRTDRWTPIHDAPAASVHATTQLLWSDTRAAPSYYEPSGDRWRPLPPSPAGGDIVPPAVVQGRVVVLNTAGEAVAMGDIDVPRRLTGVVLGDGWETLAEAKTAQRAFAAVVPTDSGLFVWGGLSVTRDVRTDRSGAEGTYMSHDDGAFLTFD